MNEGKQFEKDFKASVLDSQFYLRLNDGGGWSDAENTRFTAKNLCDCVLHQPISSILYLLELKSHTGTSIPETALNGDTKKRKDGKKTKVERLAEINQAGTFPGFVCNFRDYSETYLIAAKLVKEELGVRKSLSLDTCRKLGTMIPQKKLRVHWRYDLSVL